MAEIATGTYDALPKIASAFLKHAQQASLASDIKDLVRHLRITFQSATITFSWCDPSVVSHAIHFKSSEREFQLWCEVRGCVSLQHGATTIYSQGSGEIVGDVALFTETAKFVSNLSPVAFGVPLKVE